MSTYLNINDAFPDLEANVQRAPRFSCRNNYVVFKAFSIFSSCFAFAVTLIFGLKYLFFESVKLVIIH